MGATKVNHSSTIYGSVDEFMGVHKSLLDSPQVKNSSQTWKSFEIQDFCTLITSFPCQGAEPDHKIMVDHQSNSKQKW